ncbi:hypothetical protein EMCRGX_G000948 [Ephydatia muelleri]
MLPGHTKFWPDSYFGLLKKHYRQQDHIDNMADLVKCVCKCGQDVECVPQLYQNWQYYEWNVFLGQWFQPLSAFGRSHTFEFDREHPGVMEIRVMSSVTNSTKIDMLRPGVKVQVPGSSVAIPNPPTDGEIHVLLPEAEDAGADNGKHLQ